MSEEGEYRKMLDNNEDHDEGRQTVVKTRVSRGATHRAKRGSSRFPRAAVGG